MKTNLIALIRRGGKSLCDGGDIASGHALYDLSNDLLCLIEGEFSFNSFMDDYTVGKSQVMDDEEDIGP